MHFINLFLVSLLAVGPLMLNAADYHSAEDPGTLTVMGDSTLHKWEATTSKLEGGLAMDGDAISSLQVTLTVETLKSGKDGLDDKMYDAMKTGKFPEVSFKLTQSGVPDAVPEGMEGDVRQLTGDLTILDTTKSVTVLVTLETLEGGKLSIKGSKELDMTDFGVKPPKAMMGMVKAHPEITVEFDWILQPKDADK